jgi:diacylglycerol O-acyltransferase
MMMGVAEWTPSILLSLGARAMSGPVNTIVTNVPGPQIPLYLLGARVLETYPMLNLLTQQSLGVALFSYAGRLHWGFMSDWDLVPDLHDFVRAIEDSTAELSRAAELPVPSRPPTRP